MAALTALIIGATGATGKHLLQELLASPQYSSVSEYGRRVSAPEQITTGREKLEQKTIDFERLETAGLKDKKWDVVFITLGTTRKIAGSQAAFERIDREYVVNAARAAKSDDPNHQQRLIYVSAPSANPSSYSLYLRSKGLTEIGLAELGYNDTIVFRPAMLGEGNRPDSRPLEITAVYLAKAVSKVLSSVYMPIPTLAKALRIAGETGSAGLPPDTVQNAGDGKVQYSLISNKGILDIANVSH
ncbi:uncharacterized protein C8Q71DRAFT_742388 [Rhodofomes roseus]|uniref:NAD(P)-binding domain-containing protein n=1 Tax=Rhodofomes roseus TaxID=34475 RepID=A0ABQ8KQP9_9APHY|nr:uncharacterized protein C8Q71DRAFT_742388 [Rhodofomes roseus]KAH9840949.1 hypothetical protein C8Q71DRAFT_742388 [Rhodofomes roseus]